MGVLGRVDPGRAVAVELVNRCEECAGHHWHGSLRPDYAGPKRIACQAGGETSCPVAGRASLVPTAQRHQPSRPRKRILPLEAPLQRPKFLVPGCKLRATSSDSFGHRLYMPGPGLILVLVGATAALEMLVLRAFVPGPCPSLTQIKKSMSMAILQINRDFGRSSPQFSSVQFNHAMPCHAIELNSSQLPVDLSLIIIT